MGQGDIISRLKSAQQIGANMKKTKQATSVLNTISYRDQTSSYTVKEGDKRAKYIKDDLFLINDEALDNVGDYESNWDKFGKLVGKTAVNFTSAALQQIGIGAKGLVAAANMGRKLMGDTGAEAEDAWIQYLKEEHTPYEIIKTKYELFGESSGYTPADVEKAASLQKEFDITGKSISGYDGRKKPWLTTGNVAFSYATGGKNETSSPLIMPYGDYASPFDAVIAGFTMPVNAMMGTFKPEYSDINESSQKIINSLNNMLFNMRTTVEPLSDAIYNYGEAVNQSMTVYKPKKVQGEFGIDHMKSLSFWAENVMPTIGTSVGIMLGGFASAKGGFAQKLNKIDNFAIKSEKALSEISNRGNKLRSFYPFSKGVTNTIFKPILSTKASGLIDEATIAFNQAIVEGTLETYEWEKTYGEELKKMVLSGEITELEATQRLAKGKSELLTHNIGILMLSNMVTNRLIFGKLFKDKSIVSKMFTPGGKIVENMPKLGFFGVAKNLAKNTGIEFINEFFYEEMLQGTSQRYIGRKALGDEDIGLSEYSDEYKSFLHSPEGHETAFITAVMTGLLGGIGGISASRQTSKQTKALYKVMLANKNGFAAYFTDTFERDNEGKIVIENGKPKINAEKLAELTTSNKQLGALFNTMVAAQEKLQTVTDKNERRRYEDLFDGIVNTAYASYAYNFFQTEGGEKVLRDSIDSDAQMIFDHARSVGSKQYSSKEEVASKIHEMYNNYRKAYDKTNNYGVAFLLESVKPQGMTKEESRMWEGFASNMKHSEYIDRVQLDIYESLKDKYNANILDILNGQSLSTYRALNKSLKEAKDNTNAIAKKHAAIKKELSQIKTDTEEGKLAHSQKQEEAKLIKEELDAAKETEIRHTNALMEFKTKVSEKGDFDALNTLATSVEQNRNNWINKAEELKNRINIYTKAGIERAWAELKGGINRLNSIIEKSEEEDAAKEASSITHQGVDEFDVDKFQAAKVDDISSLIKRMWDFIVKDQEDVLAYFKNKDKISYISNRKYATAFRDRLVTILRTDDANLTPVEKKIKEAAKAYAKSLKQKSTTEKTYPTNPDENVILGDLDEFEEQVRQDGDFVLLHEKQFESNVVVRGEDGFALDTTHSDGKEIDEELKKGSSAISEEKIKANDPVSLALNLSNPFFFKEGVPVQFSLFNIPLYVIVNGFYVGKSKVRKSGSDMIQYTRQLVFELYKKGLVELSIKGGKESVIINPKDISEVPSDSSLAISVKAGLSEAQISGTHSVNTSFFVQKTDSGILNNTINNDQMQSLSALVASENGKNILKDSNGNPVIGISVWTRKHPKPFIRASNSQVNGMEINSKETGRAYIFVRNANGKYIPVYIYTSTLSETRRNQNKEDRIFDKVRSLLSNVIQDNFSSDSVHEFNETVGKYIAVSLSVQEDAAGQKTISATRINKKRTMRKSPITSSVQLTASGELLAEKDGTNLVISEQEELSEALTSILFGNARINIEKEGLLIESIYSSFGQFLRTDLSSTRPLFHSPFVVISNKKFEPKKENQKTPVPVMKVADGIDILEPTTVVPTQAPVSDQSNLKTEATTKPVATEKIHENFFVSDEALSSGKIDDASISLTPTNNIVVFRGKRDSAMDADVYKDINGISWKIGTLELVGGVWVYREDAVSEASNATSEMSVINDIFDEVHEAHFGIYIHHSVRLFSQIGLIEPLLFGNEFETIVKEIFNAKKVNPITRSAFIERLRSIFENKIIGGKTGIQETIEFINNTLKTNIGIDSSYYDKLSNEVAKSNDFISFKVIGNQELTDSEKLEKYKEHLLLRNKWLNESVDIVNKILSQIDKSIPELQLRKATKENAISIPNYELKNELDTYILNLKNKNEKSHKRVMSVLNKYGITFDDFIKNIKDYYNRSNFNGTKINIQPDTEIGRGPATEIKAEDIDEASISDWDDASFDDFDAKRDYVPENNPYESFIASWRDELKGIIPMYAIIRVVNKISDMVDTHGVEAAGMLHDNAIILSSSATKKDVYHEAFHYIYNMLLTEKERKLIDVDEETLADEFSDYYITNREYKPSLAKKILNIFDDIFYAIKLLLGLRIGAEEVFSRIQRGKYAEASISKDANLDVTRFKLTDRPLKNTMTQFMVPVNNMVVATIENLFETYKAAGGTNVSNKTIPTFEDVITIIKTVGKGNIEQGLINIYYSVYKEIVARAESKNVNAAEKNMLLALAGSLFQDKAPQSLVYDYIVGLKGIGLDIKRKDGTSEDAEIESIIEEEEEIGKTNAIKNKVGSTSMFSSVNFRVRWALSRVKQIDAVPVNTNGKITYRKNRVRNKLIPSFSAYVGAREMFSTLIDGVKNIHDPQKLFKKLEEMAKFFPSINQILDIASKDEQFRTELFQALCNDVVGNRAIKFRKIEDTTVYEIFDLDRVRLSQQILDDWKITYEDIMTLEDESLKPVYLSKAREAIRRLGDIQGSLSSSVGLDQEQVDTILYALNAIGLSFTITVQDILRMVSDDNVEGSVLYQTLYGNDAGTVGVMQILQQMVEGTFSFLNSGSAIRTIAMTIADHASKLQESSFVGIDGEREYVHLVPNYINIRIEELLNMDAASIDELNKDVIFKGNLLLRALGIKDNPMLFRLSVQGGAKNAHTGIGTKYMGMSPKQFALVDILEYMDGIFKNSSLSNYRMPIMSDSPRSYFAQLPRLNNVDDIVNCFYQIALNEHERNGIVKSSQEDPFTPYNDVKPKFVYVPVFNNEKNLARINDSEAAKNIIKDWLYSKRNNWYNRMDKEGILVRKDGKRTFTIGTEEQRKVVEDNIGLFYLNSYLFRIYAQQLLAGDALVYGNFYKRIKGVHSPKTVSDTTATWNGQEIPKNSMALYFKDQIVTAESISDMEEFLNKVRIGGNQLSQSRINGILSGFKKINATDGQGLITLKRYRQIMIQNAKWSDAHEAAYNRLVNDDYQGSFSKNLMQDILLMTIPIKPFYFNVSKTYLDDNGTEKIIHTATLHKNSEAVMIPQLFQNSKRMKAMIELAEKMEEKTGLPVAIQHESTSKLSGHKFLEIKEDEDGVTINFSNGEKADIDSSEFDRYQMFVENKYYGIQQEVPEHFIDHEQFLASQISKMIFADIPADFTYKGMGRQEFIDYVKNVMNEQTNRRYEELMNDLYDDVAQPDGTTKKLINMRKLQSMLLDAMKGGKAEHLADALNIIKNSVTGEQRFKIYLENPVISHNAENIILAAIRKKVTKMFLNGGPLVRQSGTVYDNSLNMLFDENGGIVLEAIMPYWTKKYYKPVSHTQLKDGTLVVTEWELHGFPGEALGYRIPTENSYSVYRLKVVGFGGNSLVLPDEAKQMSDEDYDVDKSYVVLPRYGFVNNEIYSIPDISSGREKVISDSYKERFSGIIKKKNALLTQKNVLEKQLVLLNDALAVEGKKKSQITLNAIESTKKQIKDIESKVEKMYVPSFEEYNDSVQDKTIYQIATDDMLDNSIVSALYSKFGTAQSTVTSLERGGSKVTEGLLQFLDISDESSSDILDPLTELNTFSNYSVGDKMIGITANHNANHFLLQNNPVIYKVPIRFNGQNYTVSDAVTERGSSKLASSNIAELLAAAVDNPNSPICSYINLNEYTSGLYFAMIRAGIPYEDVVLFMSQPAIKFFVEEYYRNGGTRAAEKAAMAKVFEIFDYVEKKGEVVDFSSNVLKANIQTSIARRKAYAKIENTHLENVKKINAAKVPVAEKEKALSAEDLRHDEAVSSFNREYSEYIRSQYLAFSSFLKYNSAYGELINRVASATKLETKVGPTIASLKKSKDSLIDLINEDNNLFDASNILNAPMIEMMYDKYIAGALRIVSDLFPYTKGFYNTIDGFMKESVSPEYTEDMMNKVHSAVTAFLSQGFKVFSNKNVAIDSLTNMPLYYAAIKNKVHNNAFFSMLSPYKKKYMGTDYVFLGLVNNGTLTPAQLKKIQDGWVDMLLSKDDDIRNFAYTLIIYAYASSGFQFSQRSLFQYIPVDFFQYDDVTGITYNKYWAGIRETIMNGDKELAMRFVDQFVRHYANSIYGLVENIDVKDKEIKIYKYDSGQYRGVVIPLSKKPKAYFGIMDYKLGKQMLFKYLESGDYGHAYIPVTNLGGVGVEFNMSAEVDASVFAGNNVGVVVDETFQDEILQAESVSSMVTENVGPIKTIVKEDLKEGELTDGIMLVDSPSEEAKEDSGDVEIAPGFFISAENKEAAAINIYSADKNGYESLSNFNNGPVIETINGKEVTFKTVEHAYQSKKALFAGDRAKAIEIYNAKTGYDASRIAQTIKWENASFKDWDKISRDEIKKSMLAAFKQNDATRELLLSTGTRELTHTKADGSAIYKWGKIFPEVLMEIRKELANSQAEVANGAGSVQNSFTFKGYVGGFENSGKGTPQGDGKDKAMRNIANSFIGEENGLSLSSSTRTSAEEIHKSESGDNVENAASLQQGKVYGQVNTLNIDNYTDTIGGTVMLARNGSLANTPLQWSTKKAILNAHKNGAEFIVGDMPNVDSQFIDYLQEIGAEFTIYHTGNKSRIVVADNSKISTADITQEELDILSEKYLEAYPFYGKITMEQWNSFTEEEKNNIRNCNQ